MSIYVLCPKYIVSRARDVKGDLCHIFLRHFLPSTRCRIAVDSSGVVISFLVEAARDNDVLSAAVRLMADGHLADHALEQFPIDQPESTIGDLIPLLVQHVGPDGRLICYQKSDYSRNLGVVMIDRAIVRYFMDGDCREFEMKGGATIHIGSINAQTAAVGSGSATSSSSSMNLIAAQNTDVLKLLSELQEFLRGVDIPELEKEPLLIATRAASDDPNKDNLSTLRAVLKGGEVTLHKFGTAAEKLTKIADFAERIGSLLT